MRFNRFGIIYYITPSKGIPLFVYIMISIQLCIIKNNLFYSFYAKTFLFQNTTELVNYYKKHKACNKGDLAHKCKLRFYINGEKKKSHYEYLKKHPNRHNFTLRLIQRLPGS